MNPYWMSMIGAWIQERMREQPDVSRDLEFTGYTWTELDDSTVLAFEFKEAKK